MTSVTEEMIEAAAKAFYGDDAWANPRGFISPPSSRIAMSRALEAALSASPAAQTEAVAWRYRYKRGRPDWDAWVLVDVDPNDWDWAPAWTDFECQPLYAAPSAPQPTEPVAWRDETEMEHIARDMAEGRFPQRSERQKRPDVADAWERITSDSELAGARKKCSMHELRRIIAHAVAAEKELAAALASPVAQQRDEGWQDIATAPKDGTWFLGWAERPDVEDQYDIWHWDAEAETDAGYGFWINAADSNLDEYPTLWKPLQPPPVLSPERKDQSNG